MQGKPRPAATAAQALAGMDQLIALSHIGQQDMAQRLGLSSTDLTCLGHVIGAGEQPITAGELAARAGLTTGAVTGVVNRLERAGYAHRQADPADRRRVRIVPEETANLRVMELYQPFYERLNALFADYTPDEVAVLTDWFTRTTDLMRTRLEEIRHG
ncbi:MarR family transcriptional regulator [Kitasatospora sp. NPDC048540]|uniref:MarR family winged helix-turn-helix transcriptional regulator n=1 Tax=unclassified Kitasatospora TaxID=2633591 RepID=UPI000539B4A9|nr:MarR family transcriptional regulator [Kitasatospora sp. MBT63]